MLHIDFLPRRLLCFLGSKPLFVEDCCCLLKTNTAILFFYLSILDFVSIVKMMFTQTEIDCLTGLLHLNDKHFYQVEFSVSIYVLEGNDFFDYFDCSKLCLLIQRGESSTCCALRMLEMTLKLLVWRFPTRMWLLLPCMVCLSTKYDMICYCRLRLQLRWKNFVISCRLQRKLLNKRLCDLLHTLCMPW